MIVFELFWIMIWKQSKSSFLQVAFKNVPFWGIGGFGSETALVFGMLALDCSGTDGLLLALSVRLCSVIRKAWYRKLCYSCWSLSQCNLSLSAIIKSVTVLAKFFNCFTIINCTYSQEEDSDPDLSPKCVIDFLQYKHWW